MQSSDAGNVVLPMPSSTTVHSAPPVISLVRATKSSSR